MTGELSCKLYKSVALHGQLQGTPRIAHPYSSTHTQALWGSAAVPPAQQ